MANKLFHIGDQVLAYLFNGFFFLTLVFAIMSPNIILGDNRITGAGTTWLLIIAVALIVCGLTYPSFKNWFRQVFIIQKKRTAIFLFLVVVLWQIVFVFNVHPAIGFDAGATGFKSTFCN